MESRQTDSLWRVIKTRGATVPGHSDMLGACFQNLFLAAEQRPAIAHGETLVITHIFLGLIKDF